MSQLRDERPRQAFRWGQVVNKWWKAKPGNEAIQHICSMGYPVHVWEKVLLLIVTQTSL